MFMSPIMSKSLFKLNSNAFLVSGVCRSLICDLEREVFYLIPSSLKTILENKSIRKIDDAIDIYGEGNAEYIQTIIEYFDFLIEKDLVFFSNNIDMYPKMDLSWDSPSIITNAIIDINERNNINFKNLFFQIDNLYCQDIQIRCFKVLKSNEISKILEYAEGTVIKSIQFIIPFISHDEILTLIELCVKFPRISFIQCYGNVQNKVYYTSDDQLANVVSINANLTNSTHCGVIGMNYFTSDIKTFTEAQHHNTCLNRKISIDVEGNIKNCPSMAQSFGNIRDTTLQEALEHPDFKKYWNVKKDQISVCKDCEFRYICTDCRAYIENPEDMYSKPLKCGYNPYTAEWEEWSTNPLKQKAIDHYGMREMV